MSRRSMRMTELVGDAVAEGRREVRAALARHAAFCRSALRGGLNYGRNIAWVLARTLEGQRLRGCASVAAGQLSLASQAAALAVLYWYAEQAQADAVVALEPFGLAWRAREDFWLLGGVVAASGFCFLANAGLLHWSERLTIRIGETDLARRLTEVVRTARRLPDPRAPEASRILLDNGMLQIGRGCRFAAASVVTMLGAVTPVIGGLAAGVALLVIDPLLTGLLAVGAGLWCLLLYPLMMRQVAFTERNARAKKAFAKESRALLQSPSSTAAPETMTSAVELANVVIGRRYVMNDITVVLQTGTAVFGTAAALYLAASIIGGDDDWPKFILYLGGLRIALNGGFAAPRAFGTVSRFYPRMLLSIGYLQSTARLAGQPLGRIGGGDAIDLGRLPDGGTVDARGGERIALAAPATTAQLVVAGAFLDARAGETGRPLAAAWVRAEDPHAPLSAEASIHLVEANALAALGPAAARACLERIAGLIVLVHRDETRIGEFGESHLLVVEDGGLSEHARLGTAASRTAIQAFATRARAAADNRAGAPAFDAAMDDQEDEEG